MKLDQHFPHLSNDLLGTSNNTLMVRNWEITARPMGQWAHLLAGWKGEWDGAMGWIGASIAWLLAVGGLTYWFVHASNFVALLCGFGLAGLLYALRTGARLLYGLLECLVGSLLLAQVIFSGTGRGPFSPDFSPDFARFDPSVIVLQSLAALFLIVRGLDSISAEVARIRAAL